MIILYDTREQKNIHIINYFHSMGIKCEKTTFKFGDYSFICNGKNYQNKIVVERKNSLDEISNNFTRKRDQFRNEFWRVNAAGAKCFLIIENAVQQDIINHNYNSKMHSNALLGSLKSWHVKHAINIFFIKNKNLSGKFIHDKFLNYLEKEK
jgi:ERCC4-type nuclease